MLLVAVSLLVDAKTNSLLFFPSNMASKMSLQSDMLSFPLISRPITAPIKKKLDSGKLQSYAEDKIHMRKC